MNDLASQLSSPQHCYVEIRLGVLWRHSCSDPCNREKGWAGKPIRFTLLAARRVVAQLRADGCPSARFVCIDFPQNSTLRG